MRVKDELKKDALFAATIKVVNKIGLVASSVSKIAKEAGISPATIYIYHKNKEDLLVSTYVDIKRSLSEALLRNFDESLPVRDILRKIWMNGFEYASSHREQLGFADQFSNSPCADLVNMAEVERHYAPIKEVVDRGIREKVIKNVEYDLIIAFMLKPMLILSNRRICTHFDQTKANIEKAFDLAWDAIKK